MDREWGWLVFEYKQFPQPHALAFTPKQYAFLACIKFRIKQKSQTKWTEKTPWHEDNPDSSKMRKVTSKYQGRNLQWVSQRSSGSVWSQRETEIKREIEKHRKGKSSFTVTKKTLGTFVITYLWVSFWRTVDISFRSTE